MHVANERARSRRVPRGRTLALGLLAPLLAAGCSTTSPSAATAPRAVAAEGEGRCASADPRQVASDHFHQGKALALSGDPACAHLEFQAALDGFRASMRPGDASDLAFAGHLWESVRLYESLPAEEEDDRGAESPGRDGLIADGASAASPDEIAVARRELEGAGASGSFDVPIEVNDAVLNAVAYYQFRTPKAFAAALQRSGRYLPLMRSILRENGLPEDLVYIAMIESAFKWQAHSRAAAKGYWQFIAGTGKRYGLKTTRDVDERSDPVKSTRAAAAYFRDLYEMFGDWYLAMAAYNAGEGRILRGLQRTGSRTYWELREGNALRRETKDYVPYFIAAALISRDPARFGFDVVPDAPLEFDVVDVPRPVELARIARELGVDADTIQSLNGELRGRTTPRGVTSYPLRVPKGAGAVLAARLEKLPAAPAARDRRIAVRKGESLAAFAARNRVSVEEVRAANDLRPNVRLKRGQLLVVPSPLPAPKPAAALAEAADAPVFAAPVRGEVRALPTPSAAVADATSLGRDVIVVPPAPPAPAPLPSRVEIPAEGFETETPKPVALRTAGPARSRNAGTHTVLKGETLYRIATRYGVTVDDLKRANRIGRNGSLRVGQRLSVPESGR